MDSSRAVTRLRRDTLAARRLANTDDGFDAYFL